MAATHGVKRAVREFLESDYNLDYFPDLWRTLKTRKKLNTFLVEMERQIWESWKEFNKMDLEGGGKSI